MQKKLKFGLAAVTALTLTASLAVFSPSFAVPSYPSWADIQAAKASEANKKAMIANLQSTIASLSAEADRLGKIALVKGEAFNQAQDAVDAMTLKVKSLQHQADRANEQADNAKAELGQIAAQMYRDGAAGTSIDLFLNAGEADNLLYQLGTQDRLAGQSQSLYERAVQRQQYAQSITDSLKVAKVQLADEAKVAQAAFDEAQSAAAAVQAKVDANNALNKVFYAQLASLRSTTATLERQRAEGLAAEARQNAGTSLPVAPELYNVGSADQGKVATALAYAKAQLGEPYVLGGMGPNVWDCSGITKAAYSAAGIYIGTHSATNQFNTMAAERRLVPLSQAVQGDLMWYSQESAFNGDKYHVVIFLGGGMMLEAPNPARTVRIVPLRYGELFPYAGRPSA
ncbi:MAG: hypothetical protein RL196_756 [Actinomycetota bacterium]